MSTVAIVVNAIVGKPLTRGRASVMAAERRPPVEPLPINWTTSGTATASTRGGCTMAANNPRYITVHTAATHPAA